jgi:N-acetylglucosamine malate deacetylase 1
MKLDILAFGAHPDDVELAASGTIAAHIAKGYKVGIIDLTLGELGTRGTVEVRKQEAARSAQLLGISIRENLQLADGFFTNDKESQLKVVEKIRQYQPSIVLANAISDRHPDHGKGAQLVKDACFISGLRAVITKDSEGMEQQAHRPNALYHYIQSNYIEPDFVVDITNFWELKMASIKAFSSQFYSQENISDPQTFISSPEFMHFIESRAREFGLHIGKQYAEGFTVNRQLGVSDLFDLL